MFPQCFFSIPSHTCKYLQPCAHYDFFQTYRVSGLVREHETPGVLLRYSKNPISDTYQTSPPVRLRRICGSSRQTRTYITIIAFQHFFTLYTFYLLMETQTCSFGTTLHLLFAFDVCSDFGLFSICFENE